MTHNERAQNLLALIQDHAPNGKAQGMAAALFNRIQREVQLEYETRAEAEHEIETQLAMILSDGLMYGNWPWGSHQVQQR